MRKILILTLCAFCLILTGCSEKKYDFSSEYLVVGMECAYAPFNYAENVSTPTNVKVEGASFYVDGYDVEIALLIGKALGKKVKIKMIEWESLITELKTGNIDLIIAGMSPTEVRKKQIIFSDGYYRTTHVVLMKKDAKYTSATKLTDFNGARGVGQIETLYDTLLDQLPGITHQEPLNDVGLITTAIKSGTADIAILEKPVAEAIIASNETLTYVELDENFNVKEEDIIVSIGLRKSDKELASKVNDALKNISDDKRNEIMLTHVRKQAE